MCEHEKEHQDVPENHDGGDASADGVIRQLGDLSAGTVVTEAALARMFGRHPTSIKRAVERGELPPPTRLLGSPVWTVGAIQRHIEAGLEAASKEAQKQARMVEARRP